MNADEALALAVRHRRTGILLDTNLLLVLLVASLGNTALARCKKTSAYSDDDAEALALLLGGGLLVITPHIATELSNLGGTVDGEWRGGFFEALRNLCKLARERRAESRHVVDEPCFARLGLADAAIVKTRNAAPLVITDDFSLYRQLADDGRPVINFSHLRPELLGIEL